MALHTKKNKQQSVETQTDVPSVYGYGPRRMVLVKERDERHARLVELTNSEVTFHTECDRTAKRVEEARAKHLAAAQALAIRLASADGKQQSGASESRKANPVPEQVIGGADGGEHPLIIFERRVKILAKDAHVFPEFPGLGVNRLSL